MNIRVTCFACCALLTAALLAYFCERRPEPTFRISKPGMYLAPPEGAPMTCGRCICYVGDKPPNLNEGC
jgi:hypothetical protein